MKRFITLTVALFIGAISSRYTNQYYDNRPFVQRSIFNKIGDGFKKAEPFIVPAAEIGGELLLGGLSVQEPMFYDPYVQRSIFNKIGDGFKTAGKDIAKGGEIAAPYAIKYGIPAAEIGGELLLGGLSVQEPMFYDPYVQRSIFNKIGDGFKTAGKDIAKGGKIAAPYAIQYGIPAAEIGGELLLGGLSV
jgi:hypothetical protein